jgi:type IX secretion system PorP/SprF family membrane protein
MVNLKKRMMTNFRTNIMDTIIKVIAGASLLLLLTIPRYGYAQQDPMYTQYMFNTQTINPAYAGSWESFGFLALSRLQWVGINGAPVTNTFSFQAPTRNYMFGYGLNLIHDKIGLTNRFGVFGDYSYAIEFNNNTKLRMGLKAGFTSLSHNLNAHTLYPDDVADPMFQGVLERRFLPNFGVGLFLDNDRYYIGLSSPKLINNRIEDSSVNYSAYAEFRHFFFITGYVFDITNNVKFKPTFLVKATFGAPVEADVSANLLFNEKFWLGAMYRTGDAVGFIAQWLFDDRLRVGYAYDYSISQLRGMHFNTHELMVSYELRIIKQAIVSPRYF